MEALEAFFYKIQQFPTLLAIFAMLEYGTMNSVTAFRTSLLPILTLKLYLLLL